MTGLVDWTGRKNETIACPDKGEVRVVKLMDKIADEAIAVADAIAVGGACLIDHKRLHDDGGAAGTKLGCHRRGTACVARPINVQGCDLKGRSRLHR